MRPPRGVLIILKVDHVDDMPENAISQWEVESFPKRELIESPSSREGYPDHKNARSSRYTDKIEGLFSTRRDTSKVN